MDDLAEPLPRCTTYAAHGSFGMQGGYCATSGVVDATRSEDAARPLRSNDRTSAWSGKTFAAERPSVATMPRGFPFGPPPSALHHPVRSPAHHVETNPSASSAASGGEVHDVYYSPQETANVFDHKTRFSKMGLGELSIAEPQQTTPYRNGFFGRTAEPVEMPRGRRANVLSEAVAVQETARRHDEDLQRQLAALERQQAQIAEWERQNRLFQGRMPTSDMHYSPPMSPSSISVVAAAAAAAAAAVASCQATSTTAAPTRDRLALHEPARYDQERRCDLLTFRPPVGARAGNSDAASEKAPHYAFSVPPSTPGPNATSRNQVGVAAWRDTQSLSGSIHHEADPSPVGKRLPSQSSPLSALPRVPNLQSPSGMSPFDQNGFVPTSAGLWADLERRAEALQRRREQDLETLKLRRQQLQAAHNKKLEEPQRDQTLPAEPLLQAGRASASSNNRCIPVAATGGSVCSRTSASTRSVSEGESYHHHERDVRLTEIGESDSLPQNDGRVEVVIDLLSLERDSKVALQNCGAEDSCSVVRSAITDRKGPRSRAAMVRWH